MHISVDAGRGQKIYNGDGSAALAIRIGFFILCALTFTPRGFREFTGIHTRQSFREVLDIHNGS